MSMAAGSWHAAAREDGPVRRMPTFAEKVGALRSFYRVPEDYNPLQAVERVRCGHEIERARGSRCAAWAQGGAASRA